MSLESDLGVSRRTADKLRQLGYSTTKSLRKVHVPDLLDAGMGWSTIKKIVKKLVTLGLKPTFEAPDVTWTEEKWHNLVNILVRAGIVKWEEVAICVLGELNPPQVGTSIASNLNFQRLFAPGKCMQAVMAWFYGQSGRCAKCGRRLHMEVDHVKGKNEFIKEGRDPQEADTLANLQLLCKRCNVVKRESHLLGGLSFHTAQAALMWILLVKKPATYDAFKELCRRAGLTMADVRFQEAWAMAEWLRRDGLYPLDLNNRR
ncbi:MAG TPA: HNH endonuclease signature motif containing protein [Gemmataceae bacterium]|jgi:5-methylcytosine-specific restriction endonuclease McrA